MRALALAAIVAAAACHHGPDQDRLGHEASAAMKDYTRALNEDGPKLRDAITGLSADVAVGSDAALGDLHDRVLPPLDRLLAAGDRAMAAADAYVATGIELDEQTAHTLKQMRGRNDTMHRLRDRLGAIHAPLTPASTDEMMKALMNAGTALLVE